MNVGTFFAERLCEFARCAVVTRNALSLSKEITFKGTKYTDLISSSVMTFMFFYASIYLQAKVTIIFGSLAEYLGFF